MHDDFFNEGMVSAMNREYMRGFEKGYEACMQVLTGVMQASLDDNSLITNSSQLDSIAKDGMPENSKALAVALHIASDRKTFDTLMKENAEPLSAHAVKMLMKNLEETEGMPNPLSALAGHRNKAPVWN